MNDSASLPLLPFAYIYEKNIEHPLRQIDLFLKTTSPPYSSNDVTALLHISTDELTRIMNEREITVLNMVNFFSIMQVATSYICRLLQREWKYLNMEYYTPEAIAYIYELNPAKVNFAFEQSGLAPITSHNIKELFSYIYVPIMNM